MKRFLLRLSAWWYDYCLKHGKQEKYSYNWDRFYCPECEKEDEEEGNRTTKAHEAYLTGLKSRWDSLK